MDAPGRLQALLSIGPGAPSRARRRRAARPFSHPSSQSWRQAPGSVYASASTQARRPREGRQEGRIP
eukprot:6205368-Lingulodinium_polyedra.AAC.1